MAVFLMLPVVKAACTVTVDKAVPKYYPGENVVAQIVCSSSTEKSKAYTVKFYNSSSCPKCYSYSNQSGTTPATTGQAFYHAWTIPSTVKANNASKIYFNMTVTPNSNGQAFFNISTTVTSTSLVIKDINISSKGIWYNEDAGLKFRVYDQNNNYVENADCFVHVEESDGTPLLTFPPFKTYRGLGAISNKFQYGDLYEGRQYEARIFCNCLGNFSADGACFNTAGTYLGYSSGLASYPFKLNTSLKVNTVVDQRNYTVKEYIHVCANITNNHPLYRKSMDITYQFSCGLNGSSSKDKDRHLIAQAQEERSVDAGLTQMKCYQFYIDESENLQGRTTTCYAATRVVLKGTEAYYATTSSNFNITSDELQVNPDWKRINISTYNSVINLSDYSADLHPTKRGNVDMRVFSRFTSGETPLLYIKNYTVRNHSAYYLANRLGLEYLEDGLMELEIKNVNLSMGWYNVTISLLNLDERVALALENSTKFQMFMNRTDVRLARALENMTAFQRFENRTNVRISRALENLTKQFHNATYALQQIANKTGTFHFEVDCPAKHGYGSDMPCTVTAQVEDTSSAKEVKFTCYILDDSGAHISETSWNKMVNSTTAYTDTRTYLISKAGDFSPGSYYTFQCEMSYYNFGSRTDHATDRFELTAVSGPVGGGGAGSMKDIITNIMTKTKEAVSTVVDKMGAKPSIALFFGMTVLLVLVVRRIFGADEDEEEEDDENHV